MSSVLEENAGVDEVDEEDRAGDGDDEDEGDSMVVEGRERRVHGLEIARA